MDTRGGGGGGGELHFPASLAATAIIVGVRNKFLGTGYKRKWHVRFQTGSLKGAIPFPSFCCRNVEMKAKDDILDHGAESRC